MSPSSRTLRTLLVRPETAYSVAGPNFADHTIESPQVITGHPRRSHIGMRASWNRNLILVSQVCPTGLYRSPGLQLRIRRIPEMQPQSNSVPSLLYAEPSAAALASSPRLRELRPPGSSTFPGTGAGSSYSRVSSL